MTLNTQKTQECRLKELNPSFLYDLQHGEVSNEYWYIEKMSQSVVIHLMGGFYNKFLNSRIYIMTNLCLE